ncbi:EAL domain-containing protein [Acidovorax sp. MR-S7]|uniref:sensor domain-containing protein n=1 Tax=Acidovorax sp. MR-S7 TaxID=1268622 RepID=UPI000399AB16|nr:EAL domain-containing protein [Acidovorax sp. MR-S7]GAD22997.1 predicted signal transduction protein containing a membrane domain, an EAL and a GGDEF domain [Acidovorax sp. MR-S7]
MEETSTGKASRITPGWGMVLYLALGVAWVFVGDALLAAFADDPRSLTRYQTWKGWAYVLFTGLLAWWLLRRMHSADRRRGALERDVGRIGRYASAGVARVALDGRVLWADERLCGWLGMSRQEAGRHVFSALVPPSDMGWAMAQLERLRSGQIDHYQDKRLCRPADGRPAVPVLCTVSHVPAADGEPEQLVCVLQDIGEAEAARAALERSETRLRLALDGSGSGMWDWDMAQSQATYSQGVVRMLRYDGERLGASVNLLERLHPEDTVRVRQSVLRTLCADRPFQETARLQCFDGTYRWFHARGMRHMGADGRPERFSGILTDLTAERQAQQRQRLAATVVDNTIEGVVVTDAHSRILSVNAAFTRLMGYTEAELLGKTPRVFKSGRHDRAFYEALWESLRGTGHWRGEIWNRRKNGEIFPERMSLSAVHDAVGQVTHYVCMFSDISEEKAQRERLEFLAHCDPLTGIANRAHFGELLAEAVREAGDRGERLAVLQLNLDRFKDVNGSYGHAVGDEVLKHIARQMQEALRPGDLLGRMAGDELAVLARALQRPEDAGAYARELIAAVARPWRSPEGLAVVASASVGICLFPDHMRTAQTLQQGAHAAVYGAKALGRGAWCFFDEGMTQAAHERLAMEARLRMALREPGQLQVYYQPQVDIASGRIVGAEALVRWFEPGSGRAVSPAQFIPVAESSGLIGPLGEWVLAQVCLQGRQWRAEGLPPLTLAVNISQHQFHLTDLSGSVAAALEVSGYPPQALELEITESALAARPEEARQVLQRLRAQGLRIAVDDFGTGYSSLAHLKRFPIDVLKIDQGFIRDIPRSADDMAISAAIIAMGRSLGLSVLAEGVETAEQLAFLRERGCDAFQGYLCSRPLPPQEFAALLRAR